MAPLMPQLALMTPARIRLPIRRPAYHAAVTPASPTAAATTPVEPITAVAGVVGFRAATAASLRSNQSSYQLHPECPSVRARPDAPYFGQLPQKKCHHNA